MVIKDRVAGWVVPVAAALSLAPFLLMAWAVWDVQRLVPEMREQSLAVQHLIGRVDYLDEALTASARLAAATGESRWEARYLELEEAVFAAIDSLGRVAAEVDQPGIGRAIAEVADTLAVMEHRAFELARAGDLDEAAALLESPAYEKAKQAYQDRKTVLLGGLADWVMAAEERTDDRLSDILILALVSLLILLVVWSVSGYLVRRQMEHRRAVEDQLREAEERLRAIVEVAPVAIIRVDRDRIVQYWNPAAEEIFGWSAEEVVGRPYPLTNPDHEPEADEIFRRSFGGEQLGGVELRRQHKDGSTVTVQMWNAGDKDDDGEVHALVGILADVTAQRNLERRLQQAEKLEAIGQLAGGIAHDFNNVMTAIQGHAELLLEAIPPGDPIRSDLQEIRKSAGRATDLTRKLLAFSRRQVLQPRVLDLAQVVRELEPMLQRLIGERIRLELEEEEGLGRVEADPTQVEQVIVNLAVNARDAMPDGGRLTLCVDNRELTARDTGPFNYEVEPGRYVRLAVEDTGEGMDEDTRRQIFEPFFTTKRDSEGTGLGLATVFGIVKQSGGYVWVDSRPGDGTRFEILLPRVDKPLVSGQPGPITTVEDPALTPTAPAEAGASGTATRPVGNAGAEAGTEAEAGAAEGAVILLVEDDHAVRRIAQRILEARGYRVFPAATPAEALDRLDDLPGIDIMVTDVVLPEMDGPTLARRVEDRVPGIPTLFMSGYAEDEVVREDLATGPGLFLPKPFTAAELTAAVEQVLR